MEKTKLTVLANEVTEETVTISLVNEEQTAIYELVLFKKKYDKKTKEWNEEADVTEKFYTDLQDELGIMTEDELDTLTGKELELFIKEETGRAFFTEPKGLAKPTVEQDGDLEQGVIVETRDYDGKRVVVVDIEGINYGVNFGYSEWVGVLEKYIANGGKKAKQMARFKEITGVAWDKADELNGQKVTVEFQIFDTGSNKRPFIELKKIKRK